MEQKFTRINKVLLSVAAEVFKKKNRGALVGGSGAVKSF
jgi:hypothetical protein